MKEIHKNGIVQFDVCGATVTMSTKDWIKYNAWRTQAAITINKILNDD